MGHYPGMGDNRSGERPRLGPKAKTEAELRRERQAKALRENLRRRKARDSAEPPPPEIDPAKSKP